MPWYTGPTLLEAIEYAPRPFRDVKKPMKMIAHKIMRIYGVGYVIRGKILQGVFDTT